MTNQQQTIEALEIAVECALAGELPTSEQRAQIEAAGVNYQHVHNILKEQFYADEDDT